jgi:dTDP-4-dehydrorhamnose reductase
MESKLYGIYNVVGSQRLSKFEFAKELAQFFDMNSSLIIKSNIENAHLKAPRPHDMSLSNEKIKKDLPEFQNENIIEGLKKIRSHQLI